MTQHFLQGIRKCETLGVVSGSNPPPADPEFAPGSRFAGKFVIEKLLGQGGMGAVYQALHEGLRQRFAIKVLLGEVASNPEAVQRFMNEASASASIQSEHIARVTDVSRTEAGTAYMVMEYLEGQDLAQLLEVRGRIPVGEAVGFVLQAIEGVHHAHVGKIVHRDLKPSNLFLARKPDGTQLIKVLDFGISKMTGLDAAAGSLTTTRAMLGSPLYMSPEQLRNSKTVDSRSDIWSLGVILYELISGTVPFVGDSLGELFACILENDPIPLHQHEPSVPPALEAAVMRCLRRKKEERFGSVAELAQVIAPFANVPSQLAQNFTRGLVQPAQFVTSGDSSVSSVYQPGVASSGQVHVGMPPTGTAQIGLAQTGSGPSTWATGSMNTTKPAKAPVALLAGLSGGVLFLGAIALFVALRGRPDEPVVAQPPPPIASSAASAAGSEAIPPNDVSAALTPLAAASSEVPAPTASDTAGGPTVAAANTDKPHAKPTKTPTSKPTGKEAAKPTEKTPTTAGKDPKKPPADPFGIPTNR